MKNMKIVSKHIRLPNAVVEILEKEANEFGYKFNDWVKFILTQDAVKIKNLTSIIEESLIESNTNKLPQLKTANEIKNFIDKI